MLKISDFSYHLPQELIAQSPLSPRDSAKLLIVNRNSGQFHHHHFSDLLNILDDSWVLVINNTKVFPSRLHATKSTGGKVEVLLLDKTSANTYTALTKPGLKPGTTVFFSPQISANCSNVIGMQRILEFNLSGSHLTESLSNLGEMPVPPYITEKLYDPSEYQTVYAKPVGSAAAPTAGLHFTPNLLQDLETKGINTVEITLHVGLGTFQPVKTENITNHHMHEEPYTITASSADILNRAKAAGKRILAVGTTTVRALESNTNEKGHLQSSAGKTGIFIYPPYRFRFVDGLITNFHLPHSTLLMMVSAFCSSPNSLEQFSTFHESLLGNAYQEAINNKYRFYSFGDAMLII